MEGVANNRQPVTLVANNRQPVTLVANNRRPVTLVANNRRLVTLVLPPIDKKCRSSCTKLLQTLY